MLVVRIVHVDVVGADARHVPVEVNPPVYELFPSWTAVSEIVSVDVVLTLTLQALIEERPELTDASVDLA